MDSNEEKRELPWALVAGAGIVLLVLGGVLWFTSAGGSSGRGAAGKLPFGPAESAYAARIEFTGIKMSRAENMLNQEITFIYGVMVNKGTHSIRDIEVVVEFKDLMNQVVLRETMRPLGPPGTSFTPLGGGRSREFQLNLESVPADWNRQVPTFRVTGLVLE